MSQLLRERVDHEIAKWFERISEDDTDTESEDDGKTEGQDKENEDEQELERTTATGEASSSNTSRTYHKPYRFAMTLRKNRKRTQEALKNDGERT